MPLVALVGQRIPEVTLLPDVVASVVHAKANLSSFHQAPIQQCDAASLRSLLAAG